MFMPNYYSQAPSFEKNNAPRTDSFAKVIDEIEVKNQRVIKVESGKYRNANLKGYFLLANERGKYETKNSDQQEFEIYCLWFGSRLKKGAPKIKVQADQYSIEENYSGKVACNIKR